MKRKQQYIAQEVYLGPRGLEVDGVHLPWYVAAEPEPEVIVDGWGAPLHGLTVTFFADRVIVSSPSGESRDTLLEACRAEAVQIVRDGLGDITYRGVPIAEVAA